MVMNIFLWSKSYDDFFVILGGGQLLIEHGLIVNGKCNLVNVSTDPLEQISMDLDV